MKIKGYFAAKSSVQIGPNVEYVCNLKEFSWTPNRGDKKFTQKAREPGRAREIEQPSRAREIEHAPSVSPPAPLCNPTYSSNLLCIKSRGCADIEKEVRTLMLLENSLSELPSR
jgi:hypothetical protein